MAFTDQKSMTTDTNSIPQSIPSRGLSSFRIIVVLCLLAAAGLGLRVFDLEADAPAFFADGSQDFTTDGAYLTLFAKNEALFGQWSLFEYEHWHTFKTSLITGLSYVLFSGFGVSLAMGAMVGIILSFLGVALTILFLRKWLLGRAMLIIAVLLSFNYVLILYGRFPFSENALLFLTALVAGTFLASPDTPRGSLALGVLIASAAFFGKAFGLILAVGPIGWWLSEKTDRRWTLIGLLVASTIATLLALSFMFQGDFELVSFLWTHSTQGHGFPHGLELPFGFFENLFSFARTGLHEYTPFLSLGLYLALLWTIFFTEPDSRYRKPVTFMLSWLVAWIVILSIFNYRPLRYQYLLIIPMAVVAAVWLCRAGEMVRRNTKVKLWQIVLLVIANWYFLYHAITPLAIKSLSLGEYYRWVWYVLPIAAVITALELLWFTRKNIRIAPVALRVIAVVVVGGSIVNDARLYYDWHAQRTYGIRDANRDIAELLGPNAVVSGQIGPAITGGNQVKSFPLFVRLPLNESEPLLRQYPITHLAIPASLWRDIKKGNPQLESVPIIARFWLRDNINYVVPVYDKFGNQQAMNYQPTQFEQAARLMSTGGTIPPDSLLREFLKTHPDNRTAMVYLYHWLAHIGKIDECGPLVEKLVADYPTDFSVNILAAIYYRTMSGLSGDQSLLSKAAEYLNRAVRYNPVNEDVLRRMYIKSTPDMMTI
jgi:hypothetical protein